MKLKLALWIGTGVAVGGMAKVGWDTLQLQHEYQVERDELARQTAQLEQRLAEWKRQRSESGQSLVPPKAAAGSATLASARLATSSDGNGVAPTRALESPASTSQSKLAAEKSAAERDVERLRAEARAAELANLYGPFCFARRLSDDQRDRLVEALQRQEARLAEILAFQRAQRLTSRNPDIQSRQQQAAAQFQADTGAFLTGEDQTHLQNYERTLPARKYVSAFAGVAAFSDLAFSPDQTEELTQVIAAATPGYRNGGKAELNATLDWTTIDEGARRILSPDQMALFVRAVPSDAGTGGARRIKEIPHLIHERLYAAGQIPGPR